MMIVFLMITHSEDVLSHGEKRAEAQGARPKRTEERAEAQGARSKSAGIRAEAQGAQSKRTEKRAEAHGARSKRAGIRAEAQGAQLKRAGKRAEAQGVQSKRTGKRAEAQGARSKRTGNRAEAQGAQQNESMISILPPTERAKAQGALQNDSVIRIKPLTERAKAQGATPNGVQNDDGSRVQRMDVSERESLAQWRAAFTTNKEDLSLPVHHVRACGNNEPPESFSRGENQHEDAVRTEDLGRTESLASITRFNALMPSLSRAGAEATLAMIAIQRLE
jgi:hypothetical protein